MRRFGAATAPAISERLREFLRAGRESLAQRRRWRVSENAPLQNRFREGASKGWSSIELKRYVYRKPLWENDGRNEIWLQAERRCVIAREAFGNRDQGRPQHFATRQLLIFRRRLGWRGRTSMA